MRGTGKYFHLHEAEALSVEIRSTYQLIGSRLVCNSLRLGFRVPDEGLWISAKRASASKKEGKGTFLMEWSL